MKKNPLILVLQYNGFLHNLVGLKPIELTINKLSNSIDRNIIILPILTSSQTNLKKRSEQFSDSFRKLTQNLKNIDEKINIDILCYSMANLPIKHALTNNNLNIRSITYLSSPNKGCRLADSVSLDDLEFIEPALRGTGVHLKWFEEEYATPSIKGYNFNINSDQYYIGSRVFSTEIQLNHTHKKLFYYEKIIDTENDGIICIDEQPEGKKVAHLMSSHYDLLGLNGKISNDILSLYKRHFDSINSEEVISEKIMLI